MAQYFNGKPVKIITRTNNLINQNLLTGETGVSKAFFNGYDCIKMTAGTAVIPFYCKAGEAVILSVDLAYENEADTYWYYRYADGTNSSSIVSVSNSGDKDFSRITGRKITPSKDVVGVVITRYGSKNIVYIKDMMINYGDTALPYEPYNQLWRVRSGALIRNPKNLIYSIPDRVYSGATQHGQRGQFESKDGVITFGGVITVDSLGSTFSVLSSNTWVANYPNYYSIKANELDVLAGTYTISMKVTAYTKTRVVLLLGAVGTTSVSGTAFLYSVLKERGTTIQDEIVTKTFTVDKPMKIALLGQLAPGTAGEELPFNTISEIILNEGTTAEPYFIQD